MTLSTHTTGIIAPASEDSTISARPTKAEVLDAIVTEARCPRSHAGNTLAWIKVIVKRSRMTEYGAYYPTTAEMRNQSYCVMDDIMQHGQASTPGSAHDLIERFLLDPTKNETALFHDNRDEVGSTYYCTVQVMIGVI